MILFFIITTLFSSTMAYRGMPPQLCTARQGYVQKDIMPGRTGSVMVVEYEDYRGRRCGSSYIVKIKTKETGFFRGEILYFSDDSWDTTGRFINKESFIRAKIINWLECRFSEVPEGVALWTTLLLGRGEQKTSALFRNCGLTFLLALSGMHLTLLIEILKVLVISHLPKKIQAPITAFILFFFLWIVGLRHSLLRAWLMFIVRSFSKSRGTTSQPIRVLFIALFIHLVFYPTAIFTVSFQLSYLALFGILFFSPFLRLLFPSWFPSLLSEALSISLGAQLAINPLLFFYFGEIHPMSLFSVLLFAPLISVMMWMGILYLPLGFVPVVSPLLEILTIYLSRAIYGLGNFFSLFPPLNAGNWEHKGLIWISLIPPLILLVYGLWKGVFCIGTEAATELRFPNGNKNTTGYDGAGTQKTMGTELSDKSRCS